MPWELILIVAGLLWLGLAAMVVGLCVTAARGDRQLMQGVRARVKAPRTRRFRRGGARTKSLR